QLITYQATVIPASPGSGPPTGTVLFVDGSTPLGTAALVPGPASAQATFSTAALAVGGHTITAVYQGGVNFLTSTSSPLAQAVNPDGSGTQLSSSENPALPGDTVTCTATVSALAPGAGLPGGLVTFKDGDSVLGTGTLALVGGADQATFSTDALTAGS